jgi:integrase
MASRKKGAVGIEVIGVKPRQRLRLRWRYAGQQVTLAIGKAGDLISELKAEQVALQVAIDLAGFEGDYDESLMKYRCILDPKAAERRSIGVLDLFEKFFKYKSETLEAGSKTNYEAVRGHLRIFDTKKAAYVTEQQCLTFFKGLNHLAIGTRRSYRAILRACWRYGILRHGLKTNPWELVCLPRSESVPDPDPFSTDEVLQILVGFESSYYFQFVCGLLAFGCRPGEAIAMTWADVDFERDQVRINKSWDGSQVKMTKTRLTRTVSLAPTIKAILLQCPEKEPTALVFPAVEGGFIDRKNFLNRHWKPTLERMNVRYRPTYKCRHTVWSYAVLQMPIAEAAKQAGNLPRTLLRNYVGSVTLSEMPDLLRNAEAG